VEVLVELDGSGWELTFPARLDDPNILKDDLLDERRPIMGEKDRLGVLF